MDIFELSQPNTVFRINGKDFALVDPAFDKKVKIVKEFENISSLPIEALEQKTEVVTRLFKNKKEYIKVYLPGLTDEILDPLGQRSIESIYEKLTELAGQKFGAVIKKIDDEKKP